MTINEAKDILRGPLQYGNAEHIQAVQLVASVGRCVDALRACTHEQRGLLRGKGPCPCIKDFPAEAVWEASAAIEMTVEDRAALLNAVIGAA